MANLKIYVLGKSYFGISVFARGFNAVRNSNPLSCGMVSLFSCFEDINALIASHAK
jgi:hypothetical protein